MNEPLMNLRNRQRFEEAGVVQMQNQARRGNFKYYKNSQHSFYNSSKRYGQLECKNRSFSEWSRLRKHNHFKADKWQDEKICSLKVLNVDGTVADEIFTTNLSILEIKRKISGLVEVVPYFGGKDKTVNYSTKAVSAFLRYLLLESYSFVNVGTALEIYLIAKNFKVQDLQKNCTAFLSFQLIPPEDIEKIVELAKYLKIIDALKICKLYSTLKKRSLSPNLNFSFKDNRCLVACSIVVKPFEFRVPLTYNEKGFNLYALSETYLENAVSIDAIDSLIFYGIEMKFEALPMNKRKNMVLFLNSDCREEEYTFKIQNLVKLDFNQPITVNAGEKIEISFGIEDICYRYCCLLQGKMAESRSFNIGITSNKNVLKTPVVFVEKLFYKISNE